MSLEDSYDDYIAVMPDGHTRYFRNSLRKSTINEIQIIFLQIQLYERNNYFYKNYINLNLYFLGFRISEYQMSKYLILLPLYHYRIYLLKMLMSLL